MEHNPEHYDLGLKDATVEILKKKKKTDSVTKANKCNQCDFASSYLSPLRIHLKTHSGEKPKNDRRNSGGTLRQQV